jgi:hypothetical protein
LRRSLEGGAGPSPDLDVAGDDAGPLGSLAQAEDTQAARPALIAAVTTLEPIEAIVVGSLFGLCGRPQRTMAEIAAELGTSPAKVRAVFVVAMDRLSWHLDPMTTSNKLGETS